MEKRCNNCLEKNHQEAYFCMHCGKPLVPTQKLPDRSRVVITGMGVISSLGLTFEENWESLLAGKSGIGLTERIPNADKYPCNFSAEVKGFEPKAYMDHKLARRLTESSRYAVAAAKMAFEDSNLQSTEIDFARAGVVIGTAAGGAILETERAMRKFFANKRISPIQFNSVWPNMAAYAVAHTLNFTGYNATIVTACASSTQSLATGADAIRLGYVDVILAGGTESLNSEVGLAGFSGIGALSRNRDEPEKASRPFDKNRDGLVPGEGSGMLVLENLAHAKARGARIYAEILGYAVGSDSRHETEPSPASQAYTMKSAIDAAGISLDEIDYINPHATSTPVGDLMETQAIKIVFGERAYQVPISGTKSMTGHMLGASGSMEAIVCVWIMCQIKPAKHLCGWRSPTRLDLEVKTQPWFSRSTINLMLDLELN
jgi:3-oxoacyl-[acyl-carrier-protein] synthase II